MTKGCNDNSQTCIADAADTGAHSDASAKLSLQYAQLTGGRDRTRKRSDAAATTRQIPEAVPGQNVTVPLGPDRSYQLYWPKSRPLTDKLPVVFAADGLSAASSSPAKHLGEKGGLFAQAEQDGFAVVTLQMKREDWFGGFVFRLHDWNVPNTVMGFDPKQQDDTKYAAAVQDDMSKHFNVDPSHDKHFCVGFSNGGQVCRVMDVNAVALNSSTQLDKEPLPTPGVSALIVHGQEDEVLPFTGGLYGLSTYASRNIWYIQNTLPHGRIDRSRPAQMLPGYVQANGLSSTETVDGTNFLKRAYGREGSSVRAVEYQIKPPYGGHNYSGGHPYTGWDYDYSANYNVIPGRIFDTNHVASCFFGLRKKDDCAKEGADH